MKQITNDMVADMSSVKVLRMFAFTVKTLLARLYHRGIHVNDEEVRILRNVAQKAAEQEVSLVFMPCHKSHIDYLVVSYVLYNMGIALPHIAAGDNLNMPFVGWVLRQNGAFFIRREWGGDKLYIAIMKEYITYLLEKGYNFEAFIEGTRSRTGKLLQPKFGFIKLVLEALLADPTKDAIIVPVNIAYDKVIETPSYVNELLGTPKEKESVFQLLNSVNLLQFKWGRIDVRFGEPFSLRDFIQATRNSGKLKNSPQEPQLLQYLGYKILAEINKKSVIMPTALVGTVLLTLRGRGVGRNELLRRVTWLKSEIAARGGKTAEGHSSNTAIVDRAVHVLSDLIGHRFDTLERVYYPMKRFELSYYRNQVIHLFVPEGLSDSCSHCFCSHVCNDQGWRSSSSTTYTHKAKIIQRCCVFVSVTEERICLRFWRTSA
jgi:glycerol-3-phosphate O-acyltransferase